MPDIFRQWSAGDPISYNLQSDFLNLLVEMAQDYQRKRQSSSAVKVQIPLDTNVRIKNASGSPLRQYSVVSLGDPVIMPSDDPNGEESLYCGDIVLESLPPTLDAGIAILQSPCPPDGIVPVRIAGTTLCRVLIEEPLPIFGDLVPVDLGLVEDDYEKLTARYHPGPATIIRSFIFATTLAESIDDADTSLVLADPAEFRVGTTIKIGDEKVLLTSVNEDGRTFVVERGVSGTTASEHDADDDVKFVSGVVWAIIYLDPFQGCF